MVVDLHCSGFYGELAIDSVKIGVIIPTFNAGRHWAALREKLDRQGISPQQILVIDSSSTDGTDDMARAAGYRVISIEQRSFSHGGTRQLGSELLPWAEILVYLTQDALPVGHSAIRTLCGVFADPLVGAAYGRQLPRCTADAIERHSRLFNYPERSTVRTLRSREELGIKAAFLSNSFAGYRRSALHQVGGFPANVIMAEDSVVAARLLLKDWKVAYVAEAEVVHSHAFRFSEEFSRYFDTGVHHANEPWIRKAFGNAGGEGMRFFMSELRYLRSHDPALIPSACMRTIGKFCAYHLGLRERHLPRRFKQTISLQPAFWTNLQQGRNS